MPQKLGHTAVGTMHALALAMPIPLQIPPAPRLEDGEPFTLDRMRHVVLIFDEQHEFLGEFGRVGYRGGDFYHPLGIAAAPDGRVWVAQGFEGRVQLYRLQLEEPPTEEPAP